MEESMRLDRCYRFLSITAITSLLFASACSSAPEPKSASEAAPSTSSQPKPQQEASNVDVCGLFTADQAQQITGVAMKKAAGEHGKSVCMYEDANPKNGSNSGTVALTISQHSNPTVEDADWKALKEVRHLEPGFKNTKQLSGIGDEAWMTGNVQHGKMGVAGVIVRKGNSDFMIDNMALEYRASPTALQSVAKQIADQMH
jgi:hypothetical protein